MTYSWLASGFATTDLTLNENPTAAFGVTAIDPSGMKDVESLSTIILTFNQDVFPNAQENAKAITLTDGEGQALDITVQKVPAQPHIQITLPPTIEAGEYTLNVPEGAVCRDNGDWNRAFRRTINATGLTAYTPVSISGDEGNYGSLQTFTLTFPEGTNAVVDTTGTDERPYMIHNDSTKQTKGKLAQGEETNQILLTLDENIAAQLYAQPFNIENNLEYRQMETQAELNRKQVALQKWSFAPTISGSYAYTYKIKTSGFDMSPNHSAGFSMSIPIFSGLQRYSQVKQAKITYEQTLTNQDLLRDNLHLQDEQLNPRVEKLSNQVRARSHLQPRPHPGQRQLPHRRKQLHGRHPDPPAGASKHRKTVQSIETLIT